MGFDVRVHPLGCIIMQIQMKRVWELRHLEKGSQRNKNALWYVFFYGEEIMVLLSYTTNGSNAVFCGTYSVNDTSLIQEIQLP